MQLHATSQKTRVRHIDDGVRLTATDWPLTVRGWIKKEMCRAGVGGHLSCRCVGTHGPRSVAGQQAVKRLNVCCLKLEGTAGFARWNHFTQHNHLSRI